MLVEEGALLPDDVVEALALPVVDPLDAELARHEAAAPGGDDQRTAQEGVALVSADRHQLLAVALDRLERAHLLAETNVCVELEALLGAEVDERLALDLRVAGDVVDVLLRVRRRDLPADLLETLDDPDGRVPVARVVGGGEPRRARAEDRDVDDAVVRHDAGMLLRARRRASPREHPWPVRVLPSRPGGRARQRNRGSRTR